VRLPIGYWNIIDDPYARYAPADYTVGRRYVDFAFDMADKYGLKILLDLHGAPGSQSGLDHSGCSWAISGGAMWTLDENVELTLRALEAMVDRYGHRDSLLGVELLNEPAQSIEEIHHWELRAFYNASYTMIRERHPSLLIVFNELYPKCFSWWTDTLLEPSYYNVAMDLHIYDWQPDKANYTVEAHIESIREWRDVFREHEDMRPLIVGEWCMSYAKNATPRQDFVDANVRVFDRTMGWFAWSWKVERGNGYDDWDVQYQHSVGGPNPMHVYDAEKTDPQVTSELDDTFAIEPNPFPNPHPTSTSTHSTSTNPTTPSLRSS
jgi:glucan 1,3-beta-glucosidase